ncbi:MAG: radical SAM protein [Patescibacteria group bacterium]
MHVYEREGRFLVVIGHIPQWFVVDGFGLAIARGIEHGYSLQQILLRHGKDVHCEAEAVYADLAPLINQQVNRTTAIVENVLTSKTTVAMISVTRGCNLKSICPHCYVDANGSRGIELTVVEHRNIAKQLRECMAADDHHEYKVNLTGGEPFIRKDILDIIQAYSDAGFLVSMSTNALLIHRKYMESLKRMNVTLSVSLDGSNACTHDRIRGAGSWERVVKKIRILTKVGVRVGINYLVNNENFLDMEKTIALAHQLGCTGFNPINLVQLGRACTGTLHRVPEVDIFGHLAKHLINNPSHQHLFAASSLFSSLGAALLAGITCESCGVGNRPCVYIDETGAVYPCPNTQRAEFLLGNLRTQSLHDCVYLDHPVLSNLRNLEIASLNPICGDCDVRYFCGGDCRGETYNVTGDLRAPYVACQDRHDSLIELMWVVADNPQLFETRADEYASNLH